MNPRRSGHGDRGATLIELAIVIPLLLLLTFGTADAGTAWVARNRVEGATSAAARIAASSGDLPETDRSILESLRSSLPQDQLERLDRVVVFRSVSPDGVVPGSCVPDAGSQRNGGVRGLCNSYSGDTVRGSIPADLGSLDDAWPPTSRADDLFDPPDYVGVWVRTGNDAATGLFLDDLSITTSSIYRIQPDGGG